MRTPVSFPGQLRAAAACFLAVLCLVPFAGCSRQPSYSWQQSHADVTGRGDIRWAPRPFAFTAGTSVRYIDYESGNDAQDGSRERPWKHHPWDPEARDNAGACSGIHTYVFRRGVAYRGVLIAAGSGRQGDPVRLTSDPSWGDGEAMLYGSVHLESGWKRGDSAAAPHVPEPDKVWFLDIDTLIAPRCLWEVRSDTIVRIPLARTPDWRESDPDDVKFEWPTWTSVGVAGVQAGGSVQMRLEGRDTVRIRGRDPGYYLGATVWSEWTSVMGTPYPAIVEACDLKKHALYFNGFWGGDADPHLVTHNRYFLENKPHYLDAPGEYYYERTGERAGRLYVRLEGDRDPNGARIEAARRLVLIDIRDQGHIDISGLTFRFTNVWHWPDRWYVDEDVTPACVRLLGSSEGLRVANCRFEHVNCAVRVKATRDSGEIRLVEITDNEILHTDHAAIQVEDGASWGKAGPHVGITAGAAILRNRLFDIGARPVRSEHAHALAVSFVQVAEIAGNVLDRCYGAGIFVHGGKGPRPVEPLSRVLIHHNKVTDPLLNTNDWGGIETWQGGPGLPMLRGAVDFLRICQGTLADARTTINELYAWEFDGPRFRDFMGNPVNGTRRDAGAFELVR